MGRPCNLVVRLCDDVVVVLATVQDGTGACQVGATE
jgi:hypothetical protein